MVGIDIVHVVQHLEWLWNRTWELDPFGNHGEMKQVQKWIQAILQESLRLWPEKGLLLECVKLKCDSCQNMSSWAYMHRHVAIHAKRQGHAVANARQMDYTTNVCDRRKDVNVFEKNTVLVASM